MSIKKRLKHLGSVVGIVALSALPSAYVYAAPNSCNDVDTLLNWECNESNGILSILSTALNWMAIGVSVAVLIGIVVGAVVYASSGGNEAQAKKGIEYIRNAIIALIMYFVMYAALQYLIPGGVFN